MKGAGQGEQASRAIIKKTYKQRSVYYKTNGA